MTVNLLGMELSSARNLLTALNMQCTIVMYAAVKPLENVDSARIVRQRVTNGYVELVVCEFKTNPA